MHCGELSRGQGVVVRLNINRQNIRSRDPAYRGKVAGDLMALLITFKVQHPELLRVQGESKSRYACYRQYQAEALC